MNDHGFCLSLPNTVPGYSDTLSAAHLTMIAENMMRLSYRER